MPHTRPHRYGDAITALIRDVVIGAGHPAGHDTVPPPYTLAIAILPGQLG
jgi:hypothetical protein